MTLRRPTKRPAGSREHGAARKNAGIAQERLAMIAGLDRAYVGEIERGRANPSLKTMWKLARAIGVHPRQFLADDPEDYAARASEFAD